MNLQEKLETLIRLAEAMEVPIRREALGGEGGGLCVLKGKRVLFVDFTADEETRYDRTLEGLASLSDVDAHYLPPEVREDLERRRAK